MPAPIFEIYSPGKNETIEQKFKNLYGSYVENTQQLQWLLSHLDDKNVMKAKSVAAEWIYANTLNANQITAGYLSADRIEAESIGASKIKAGELIVGTNVNLGTAQDETGVVTIVDGRITADYISALGLTVGTHVGLGTAQDSAGVTTIIGGTVNTSYVNALNVTAASVKTDWVYAGNIQASQITSGYISADRIQAGSLGADKLATGQLVVGTNVGLGSAQDSVGVVTIINGTVTAPYINALGITAASVAAENITGTYITGKTIRTASSGSRVQIDTANGFAQYDSSGVKRLSVDIGSASGKISFYDTDGVGMGHITAHNGEMSIYTPTTDVLKLGAPVCDIIPYGRWNCQYAAFSNLEYSGYATQSWVNGNYSPIGHSHSGYATESWVTSRGYVDAYYVGSAVSGAYSYTDSSIIEAIDAHIAMYH